MKNICWGSPDVVPHPSWLSGLKFNDPEEPTAFGLSVEEGAPKAFLMTLQGILLRFLLYKECKSALKVQKRSKGRSYMYEIYIKMIISVKEVLNKIDLGHRILCNQIAPDKES